MASSVSQDGGDHIDPAELHKDEALQCNQRLRQSDLATLAGCSLRKLRTLIENGFVDKAHGKGRGAFYSDHHVCQAVRALDTLAKEHFTHSRLAYETSRERTVQYGVAVAQIRASVRNLRRGTTTLTLDLACGIKTVVMKNQPPQVQAVQEAVLNAVAEVLARERVRMIEMQTAIEIGRSASPFRL